MTPALTFDDIYLAHGTEIGGDHLATLQDVALARVEEDAPLLTQARVKELFTYTEKTGELVRKVRINNQIAGTLIGTLRPDGYVGFAVDKREYLAHRVIFLYMTGVFPTGDVDHMNGDRSDNTWLNLRECTRSENAQNVQSVRPGNKSTRTLGVSLTKSGKFHARLMVNGASVNLGKFKTRAEAFAAYCDAKLQHHTHHDRLFSK